MNEKFYVTDCEGPLSINDNAYEIADYFIDEPAEPYKKHRNGYLDPVLVVLLYASKLLCYFNKISA